MELTPMRYKNYVWPHNPETYTISFARKVVAQKVPYGRYGMQDLGLSYRMMEGEGEFAGEGAYDEFKKLATVFYEGGAGVLVHPVWMTTKAYFVSLELTQEPLKDYVRYRFAFWEECEQDNRLLSAQEAAKSTAVQTAQNSYTVARGDTLWGIAKRYGVTLGELLRANPQIKNPNYIRAGEQVTLP